MAAEGVYGLRPMRVFGFVSATAILLVTLIYAACLCLQFRSVDHRVSFSLGSNMSCLSVCENSHFIAAKLGSKNSPKARGAGTIFKC